MRNYFQADTILLGGMSVKKNFNHFTINLLNKDNDKQNFTRVIKYFSVATALVVYFDVKHADILRVANHVCCYLFQRELVFAMISLEIFRNILFQAEIRYFSFCPKLR